MKRIVLSPFACAVLLTLSFAQRVHGEDYMFTIVPKIELKDATPKDAIDRIVDAASKAGANERGFAGVSIEVDAVAKVPTITMNVQDVPLGVSAGRFGQEHGIRRGVRFPSHFPAQIFLPNLHPDTAWPWFEEVHPTCAE